MKWSLNQTVDLVFLVVYREILQLTFVEQLLEMMSKAFVGSVLPTLQIKEGVVYLGQDKDLFGPQFMIVYEKWDSTVK